MVNKKVYLYVILVLIVSYIFGLHQYRVINVSDIHVKRLFGYKFTSLPVYTEPPKHALLLYHFGLVGKFELQENSHILLNFQNIMLNKQIHVSFNTSKNEKNDFLMIHSRENKEVIERKKCLYSQETRKNNDIEVYEIFGFIKSTDSSFYIVGNNEKDVVEVFDGICPK